MRARNFNIDSLAVSRTDRESISRMTITLHGDDVAVEQATKQLYRLVDVLKVQDVTADQLVEHELALVKVRADRRQPGRGDQDRRAVQGPRRRHRAGLRDRRGDAAPRGRSTPSSRCCAATGSRSWSAPARWSCCAARARSRRHSSCDSADVLRRRRRSARPRRADGRDHRLRQPGPRPRAEPARQRRRRRRRPRAGLQEPRARRGGRASGRGRRRRRQGRRRDHDRRPGHGPEGGLRRARSSPTCGPASC